MGIKETFKETVRAELAFHGMTAKELAALSGVNPHSLGGYLGSRGQQPSLENAVKIARALGVSVDFLATGEEGPRLGGKARAVGLLWESLDRESRRSVGDFMGWLKSRR